MEYVKQAWGSNTTADIEKHIEETCLTHVTFDYVREHTREAVLAAQKSSSALPTINSQWLEYAEWSKVTHAGRVMPLNTSDRQKLGRADLWGKFGRILKKTAPDVSLHSTIWEITVGERERAGTWKIKVKSTWRAIGRAVCISESNNQSGQLIKTEDACLPSWNERTSSDVTDAVERLCWLLHVFCRSSRLNHSCSCWLFLTGQQLAQTPLVQTQQLASVLARHYQEHIISQIHSQKS